MLYAVKQSVTWPVEEAAVGMMKMYLCGKTGIRKTCLQNPFIMSMSSRQKEKIAVFQNVSQRCLELNANTHMEECSH